jgi:hypothetical protein
MSTFTIRPSEVASVLRAHAKSFPMAVKAGAGLAAQRGRTHLVRTSPVDTGMYKNSWVVLDLAMGMESRVTLENNAPHAGIIELGARPHPVGRAGIEALTQWVKRKILRGAYSGVRKNASAAPKRGRKLSATAQAYKAQANWTLDDEAKKIAFAIAKKIEKEGQKPTYHLRDSIPKLRKFLIEEINRQVERVLKRRMGIA